MARKKRRSYLKNISKRGICHFCRNAEAKIDYKDIDLLTSYTNLTGKIKPAKATKLCNKHQKRIASAVKKARYLAFIPYVKIIER